VQVDPTILIFLSSGLFLGWALGANDAANVFGTAVGTKMIPWLTAAIICSVFLVLGAVVSGAGAAHTLGKLGSITQPAGAFMAALSAALSVFTMTKAGLPVSTTQAIVGAIVGWNLFSGVDTDINTLSTILATWIICPVLAALIAMALFSGTSFIMRHTKPHMLRVDAYTRVGLLVAGAFGAYSLGANNISNVVGVFLPSSPFRDIVVGDVFTISAAEQLFLLGGLAIAVGVLTYSKRVMLTVGTGLSRISPIAAWAAVTAHSIVLFIFASRGLEAWLAGNGLPTIPLVPVSSSQAVVGAVVGITLMQGMQGLRVRMLLRIVLGWVLTPFLAAIICFIGLFFLQNVFAQSVL